MRLPMGREYWAVWLIGAVIVLRAGSESPTIYFQLGVTFLTIVTVGLIGMSILLLGQRKSDAHSVLSILFLSAAFWAGVTLSRIWETRTVPLDQYSAITIFGAYAGATSTSLALYYVIRGKL